MKKTSNPKIILTVMLAAVMTFPLSAVTVVSFDAVNDNYITSFTVLGGSGSGATVADFGGDAQNDHIRHHSFSAPTTGDYLTTANGTDAGYDFDVSTAIANIRQVGFPPAPGSGAYFETAVTAGDAIRNRPFTSGGTTTANMSTASWIQFTNNTWDALGSGNASFDATSTLSVDAANNGNQTVRFLVLAGGNYYVSDASSSVTSLDFDLSNVGAATFYTYSNALDGSTILFDQSSESSVVGSSLSNITALGIYSDKVNFDGTAIASNAGLSMDLTQFSANVVPEPSTAALLALAMGMLFASRRRRS